jgi:hypothetical protein
MSRRLFFTGCAFFGLWPSIVSATVLECNYTQFVQRGVVNNLNETETYNTEDEGWKTNVSEYKYDNNDETVVIHRGSGAVTRESGGVGMTGTCTVFTKPKL